MDRKTEIKQFTQGHSLSVIETTPVQQGGGCTPRTRLPAERRSAVFWSQRVAVGGNRCLANTTAKPNS